MKNQKDIAFPISGPNLVFVEQLNKSGSSWIIHYTHNAMSSMFDVHTTMWGVPENPKIDPKITNLLQLCRELYCLTSKKWWPS